MVSEKTPFVSRREAAVMLGVSVQMIDDMRSAGQLPSMKLGKRLVRIPTANVLSVLNKKGEENE